MNKSFFYKSLAIVSVAFGLTCGFGACSDDDVTTQLEIAGDVLTEGIEAEINGKVTLLQITSNGTWTIDVPQDAKHWVYVPVKSGEGNRNVPVSIDSNFGSASGRSTTLTITAGKIVHKVSVTQIPTYQGEAVANDNEAINYLIMASQKGVGVGLNLESFETYDFNVVNLNAIYELQKINSSKYKNFFTYNIQAKANAQGSVTDSVDTKKDSLGVALSFDITYGDFKMNIGGAYHGDESKNHLQTEYNYGAKYNIANASVDLASMVATYNIASASNDTSVEADWQRSLLTPGFIAAKEWVEEAYNEGDEDDLNDAIEDLVKEYGPVVVSGCDLGGSMSLWMKYNRDSIADILRVDTAHVKIAVESGLLKIGANVEVSYKKEGIRVLENSSFKYRMSGGEKTAQDAVASVLSTPLSKNENDNDDDSVYTDLHDKIDGWIASLNANDATTLSYTRLKIYPIWYFFQSKVRSTVKKWIKENYKDKMDIINNGVLDADVADE